MTNMLTRLTKRKDLITIENTFYCIKFIRVYDQDMQENCISTIERINRITVMTQFDSKFMYEK